MTNQADASRLILDEMYANASIFMIRGTETTATLLSGLLFYLLKNPEMLTKLVHEVRSAFLNDDDITTEACETGLSQRMLRGGLTHVSVRPYWDASTGII
jgi:cytochrome P450